MIVYINETAHDSRSVRFEKYKNGNFQIKNENCGEPNAGVFHGWNLVKKESYSVCNPGELY